MSNAKVLFFKVCRCVYFLLWCCKYPKSFCLIECASGVVYYSTSFATKVWVNEAYRAQKTGIFLELLNWYNFRKDCRVAMCCRLRNKMSMKWSPTVSTNIQRLDFSRRNRKYNVFKVPEKNRLIAGSRIPCLKVKFFEG